MATIVLSPQLTGAAPTLINTGTSLYVSLPISNSGAAPAPTVFATSITLGTAPRKSPQVLPVFVGDLAIGGTGSLNAQFDSSRLVIGQQYLLTVRGSYGPKYAKQGFTINRYVSVPSAKPFPTPLLGAHLQASIGTATWEYTLFNDEPSGSPQYLFGFSLTIVSPVSVTGTPPGWAFETDNLTYVGWFAEDISMPYPNQLAPGRSLGGFQLQSATSQSESTSYVITSWRHDIDDAGLVSPGAVASPGRAY
jgi:hypothetical protein